MTSLHATIARTAALSLALGLAPWSASFTPAAAAQSDAAVNQYPAFSNGLNLAPGAIAKFDFTVNSQDTVYFLFTGQTQADVFILRPAEFQKFQAGLAFNTLGGFRNQSGRQTITLPSGNFTIAVRNNGGANLDYALRIVSSKDVLTIRANGTEQVPPGARFTEAFTVNPADKMVITSVAEGFQAFILAPSEANKFKLGQDFVPVGGSDVLTELSGGSASGEVTLNEGTFHIAYWNTSNTTRAATYVVSVKKPEFTGGGPVNPPTEVVPFFDSNTDEGVGGTYDGETFRTRFNNRAASVAPSFLVSGTTRGQFVRIYASGVLIAQGVAGGTQLTLKASGKLRLEDGEFPITASQFNGQTESDKVEFFKMFVDTIAPVPPADVDLSADTDTGPSPDDNITAASSLTFTGTSEPLARVTMTANGKLVNTSSVQADENGDWSITFPSPRPGKTKFAAVQMDTAGNVSKLSPVILVELLKPPAAPSKLDLIKADKGRKVSGVQTTTNPTPTITGSGGKGNTVTLIVDGVETQSALVDIKGKWSITLSQPLTLGDHLIKAKQADLAGGISPDSAAYKLRLIEVQ